MALLTAGYWQDTYFVEDYWTDDYWQDYGTAVLALKSWFQKNRNILEIILIEEENGCYS